MNAVSVHVLPLAACTLLASCADFNRPLDSSFNPLDPPGMRTGEDVVDVTTPAYTPGQWLETTIPGTAFFKTLPKATEQPDKLLEPGTVLKVIAVADTYVQVEQESGEVGYVPSIMVGQRPAEGEVPVVPLVPEPIPGVNAPAPDPEVAPLDVQPVDGNPGTIDPGDAIE
jgi:hypothetical protein